MYVCIKIISKNTKKDSQKKHMKDIKIFLKKKKLKDEKRVEKDIKILLKKKKKKGIHIIKNVKRSHLTIKEIII